MTQSDAYTFGHSEHELARLLRQGKLYESITREVFSRAGIGPGMRVVDLGCGAGDVTLLLAEMVGSEGRVLAVDRAPEAIATTRRRAHDAGYDWVDLQQSELVELHLSEKVDAVAGRLVLCYVPERVDLLRRLANSLTPGGIFAFVEMEVSKAGSQPPSAVQRKAGAWVYETMMRGGFEPDMGGKLFATFAEIGLHADLGAFSIADGGRNSLVIDYLGDVVESIVPLIESMGLATREDADPQKLVAALRAEANVERRTFYLPRLTGAWARTAAQRSGTNSIVGMREKQCLRLTPTA